MAVLTSLILPWAIFALCLFLQKKVPGIGRFLKKYEIGTGFWGAISLSLPFFAYGVVTLANHIFKLSYLPFYVFTLLLIAAGMVAVQMYFYRSFLWREYMKVTWRFITIITVLMQIFFFIALILVMIMGFK